MDPKGQIISVLTDPANKRSISQDMLGVSFKVNENMLPNIKENVSNRIKIQKHVQVFLIFVRVTQIIWLQPTKFQFECVSILVEKTHNFFFMLAPLWGAS